LGQQEGLEKESQMSLECLHNAFVALEAKAGEGSGKADFDQNLPSPAFPLPSPALAFNATKAS